jgi:YidC/Oxa1 family membrane protein insertase
MESQRSLLFIALMVVTYLLFSQWQLENAPVTQQTVTNNVSTTVNEAAEFVPESSDNVAAAEVKKISSAKLITVTTDKLVVKIDTRGGDIVEVKLRDYETEQGNNIAYTIMQNGGQKYVAQSGLTGANGIDRVVKGRPIYLSEKTDYETTSSESINVDLDYVDEKGLSVTKRFIFNKEAYSVNVEYIVNNNTANSVSVQMYGQLKQSTVVKSSSGMLPTYRGAAYSTNEERYEKYDFDDISEENLAKVTPGGWIAMLEHYFVSAWVPDAKATNQLYTFYSSSYEAVIGFKSPAVIIDAGEQKTTSAIFYVGPKDQSVLEKIAPNLDLTIDYGFLWMISQPLYGLLNIIQSGEFSLFGLEVDLGGVGNWGLAIIIITLIIKGAMYPLTKAQYTSMAKMRELAPKMAKLKERFGDDRQKMSQATMEMYKKEKVNPAGGCLPLLLQMPIFLALYWVFLESVELRHAPFVFWIEDLSAMDPFFVLPILMGISMYVMQKMQPMTIQDPMQQKIMQYMPVVFSIFMAWFPSGLVLYWLISNLISIAQMKVIFAGIEKKKQEAA